MITFLRLAGLVTAAVWLGGTVFFALALDPLFGRTEFIQLLGPLHAGEVWILAAERFQLFQVVCASAALVHCLGEWLYTGRPLHRRMLTLLLALLALGSLGKLWLAPKCRVLNLQAYLGSNRQIQRQATTPAQRQAERSLAVWQGTVVAANLLALAGVSVYLFREASGSYANSRLSARARSNPRIFGY